MSHVQSPIDRPARYTKAELSAQVETLKCRVAELEETAADRIRVADALRLSEARLRAIMDHAPTEIFLVDGEGRYVLINKEFERRYGLTEEQVIGKTMGEFFPADITAEFTAQDRETFESGRVVVKEQVIEYGGVVHTDLEIKFPIVDLTGETVGVGGIATDITDRKKAEVVLQHAHDELERRVAERTAELAAAQRLAKIGNWRWSVGRGALIACSEEYARIHGVGIDEIVELMEAQMTRAIHPDDRDRVQSEFKRFDAEGIDYEIEYRIVRPDGEVRHVLELGEVVRDAAGKAIEQIGTVQDVTELKHVEEALREAHDKLEQRVEERTSELHEALEALRESEHRYREIFEESPVGIWEEDWSQAKKFIDKLARRGVKDFRRYFARRPERAKEFYDLITVTDASRAILELYRVPDLAALQELFVAKVELDDNMQGALNSLYAFLDGTMEREYEAREFRADGTEITSHMRAVMPPQRRHDWSRVIYAIDDITERKRADEALRESESRLAEAQQIAMIGHWVWDEKADREIYASAIGKAIFGTPPEWVAGSFDEWLDMVHPDDRERVGSLMDAAHDRRHGFDVEYKIVRPDGAIRFVHERARVELDEDGELIRTMGTVQDITERKQAERALRESEQRYRALFENAPVAIRAENFSKVKARIDALEIDDSNVFAGYLEQRPKFVAECAKAIEVLDVNQAALRLHNVDAEAVLKANVTQNLSDAALATLKDVLLAVHRGETSLEFETFVTRPDGSRREVEALWSVAPGYEQDYSHVLVISVDITERKRAEQALRESEARFREIFDESPVAVWEEDWTEIKRMLDRLAARGVEDWRRYFTRRPEQLATAYDLARGVELSRAMLEMYHAPDKQALYDLVDSGKVAKAELECFLDTLIAFLSGSWSCEYEHPDRKLDGEELVIRARAVLPPDHRGDWSRVIYAIEDVTERKRAEAALRESEARLAEAHRRAKMTYWEWSKETGETTHRRDAYAEIGGVPFEDVGYSYEDTLASVHADDRARVKACYQRADAEGASFEIDYRILHDDGSLRYVREIGKAIYNEAGEFTGHTGTQQDITDLRESEDRYDKMARAVEQANEMIVLFDPEDRIVFANRAWRQLNTVVEWTTKPGITFEQHLRALTDGGFAPEAIGREEEWIAERLEHHRNPTGPFELSRQDDKWISINEQVLEDGSTILVISDITERKRAEKALKESEAKLREILENSPVGVAVVSHAKDGARLTGKRLFINNALVQMFGGASGEDLIEAEISDSWVDLDRLHAVEEIMTSRDELVDFEAKRRRLDGTEWWVSMNTRPIRFDGQDCTMVWQFDITERKQAEDALRESEARFRALLDNAPLEIYLKDTEGRHIMVSRHSEELFGSPDRPVLGRTAHEIFATAQADAHLEHDRAVFESGQVIEREYEIPFDDGVHSFMSVKFPVPDAAGVIKSIGAVIIDITERKRVEEALGESEQRYRELFEQAPLSVWLEDWSSVKEAVDRLRRRGVRDWRRYFRRRPDQVTKIFDLIETIDISQATLELFRAPTKQAVIEMTASGRVTPEELAGFTENLLAFVGGETSFVYEAREVAYDGTEIFTRNKMVILPGHRDSWSRVIFSVDDITERRQAEEALRESESRLAQAQRIANVGHWAWDETTGEQLYSSGEAARIFGVPDGFICKDLDSYLEMIHPDDRDRVAAEFERADDERRGYDIEFRVEHPERGTRVVVERAEVILGEDGKVVRTVGTVQDITERRRVEDKMRQFQADLAHVSRVNMLGEMTAGLAHELNQPLAVISSYAQGCLSSIEEGKGAPETLAGALQHIVSQSARASEIIRRIRGFIRKDRRPKSRIDVNAAIGVAIELLKGETAANGIAIRMELTEPSPIAVVDDIEFQQVVLNLARNSIEMMVSHGSPSRELRIRTASNARSSGDGVGQVEISVQDTGPGVSPEIRDHVFEPFFTTKSGGLGLGLSICRSILERHDGKLWLGDDGGTGADFRFTLPLCAREGPSDV